MTASAYPAAQLLVDQLRLEAASGEQDVAVEPEVGELLDEALVRLRRACERRLDTFLPHLARSGCRAGVEKTDDVRALRSLSLPLADPAPEPRREARLRAGMADGASRPNAEEQRVSVAVVADLLDGKRAAGGRALVPVLLPRAAPEPGLAGLAR